MNCPICMLTCLAGSAARRYVMHLRKPLFALFQF